MSSIKDTINGGLQSLKKPQNAALLGAATWAAGALRKPKKQNEPGSTVQDDPFKVSNFTAKLKRDGFRLSKGYYYNAFLFFTDETDVSELLVFHCNKVTLPGWRAKTQQGKIYGIPYEIATELEQDPVWLTFNIDIKHKIEEYFFNKKKLLSFSPNSYSPEYKYKYQFQLMIQVTDENFTPVYDYILNNAMVKTVQNVSLGSGNNEFTQVTVEVVYETAQVSDVLTDRKDAKSNPDAKNRNQLRIGPFTSDISAVNQVIDTTSKVPDWFNGPTKI